MRLSLCMRFWASTSLKHENPLGLPRSGTPPNWPKIPQKRKLRGVERAIAVTSAKGGVGKSTVAANLALSFAKLGYKTGILDTDIFGPSIPTLFDLRGEPRLSEDSQLIPLTNYGVKTMSIGYLVGEQAPVVWRGLMVTKAIQQLLHEVNWGGLDILVLDMPPGTGDTHLTILQQVILDGSIIITTPHNLSLKDAVKGINMLKKVDSNILGIVENMSLFKCPKCNAETHMFGSGDRVLQMCQEHGAELLGSIPLDPQIGEDADCGKPTVAAEPSSERAKLYINIAQTLARLVRLQHQEADEGST